MYLSAVMCYQRELPDQKENGMRSARMFEIIQLLRSAKGPCTAQEIADMLEVTKRTIYRDIASLQSMRVAEFDAQTGEALGLGPGSFEYIPKDQADAEWAKYHADRKAERAQQDRARQQEKILHDNAEALAAAHQEIAL